MFIDIDGVECYTSDELALTVENFPRPSCAKVGKIIRDVLFFIINSESIDFRHMWE